MLQPSTLKFLKDLKRNNNKPWFEKNRKQYDEAREDFINMVGMVIRGIGNFDPTIAALEAKTAFFVSTAMCVSARTRIRTRITWPPISIKMARKDWGPVIICI